MERFWSKVRKTALDDCWEWTAAKSAFGYGRVAFRGANWQAHRVAYTLALGEIPAGNVVLHLCNNRKCCNPEHLRAGTQAENNRHAAECGRSVRGQRRRVFTPSEILVILSARTYREAARMVKASDKLVLEVRRVKETRNPK